MTTPYARLAELALLEARLVGDGSLDQLEDLWSERDAIVSRLPARPPAEAAPYLAQARDAVRGTQALLEASLAAAGHELAGVSRGRQVATGYGAGRETAAFDARG